MLRSSTLTEVESSPKAPGPVGVVSNARDLGFAIAALVLALQSSLPLHGTLPWASAAVAVTDIVSLLFVAWGVVWALRCDRNDLRLCASALGLGCVYLVARLDRWALSTPGRLSSALCEGMSLSFGAIPWVALLFAFVVCGFGLLQYEALRRLTRSTRGKTSTWFSAVVAGATSLLWLRAVLGYANGSPSLF